MSPCKVKRINKRAFAAVKFLYMTCVWLCADEALMLGGEAAAKAGFTAEEVCVSIPSVSNLVHIVILVLV
jgi:hypothetical protein